MVSCPDLERELPALGSGLTIKQMSWSCSIRASAPGKALSNSYTIILLEWPTKTMKDRVAHDPPRSPYIIIFFEV